MFCLRLSIPAAWLTASPPVAVQQFFSPNDRSVVRPLLPPPSLRIPNPWRSHPTLPPVGPSIYSSSLFANLLVSLVQALATFRLCTTGPLNACHHQVFHFLSS
eukprot:TRINITY_DN7232_c0_g1_i1.p3 TRINITY_DN7232_c0_g1~~TRINITY_DN7232_c0_g1_i1.p3  ORF type:complete len:103 (-),score=5.23 TRINITY_DN7232_c0_g1_i1:626-934(-)